MDDFGLMFYNARWYGPALGRFIQADTVVPGGVQGYDRYAYVNNDPTNLTDPSGHFGKCREGMSDYVCKVRQKKAHDLELKWALEAAQKKAAAIAAQMAKQAQMEAYADAMLGQSSFNSATQILGAPWLTGSGKPFATPQTSDYGDYSPNPSIWVLVGIGIPLTLVLGFVEQTLGAAEVFLARATLVQPELAIGTIPLELFLTTASLAAGDLEVSYLAYSYRVYSNPHVHQDFILTYPWGLW